MGTDVSRWELSICCNKTVIDGAVYVEEQCTMGIPVTCGTHFSDRVVKRFIAAVAPLFRGN